MVGERVFLLNGVIRARALECIIEVFSMVLLVIDCFLELIYRVFLMDYITLYQNQLGT